MFLRRKLLGISNSTGGEGGGGNTEIRYDELYFTIESLANNNTISLTKVSSPPNVSLSYSVDNGLTWTSLSISSSTTFTTINNGDKIIFKGVNNRFSNAWNAYYKFNCSQNFNAYGNTMSLLFGDSFLSNSEFGSGTSYNLCGLFYESRNLIDARNLIIPATICTSNCYNGMFRGCTNLIAAPKLPATQSAEGCYSSMFEACINLEIAPVINLVNMSTTSCKRMFCMNRNSRITTPKMTRSPILRVATSATNCYEEMFKGNGNLVEVTCLKTDNIGCCNNWLVNVSDTGTFYKSPLKTNWEQGKLNYGGIPTGWTIVDYIE